MGRRLLLFGASNLVRGLPTVVRWARAAWGDPLDVLAALGFGRSYGMPSSVPFRTLPSIVECGLWRALEGRPPVPTRALVTDVGNDIMYGAPVERILDWVEECLRRLRALGAETVLLGLPIPRLERVSAAGYALLHAIVFQRHQRLPLALARERAQAVASGLERLAAGHGATFVPAPLEWYGFDPIHVSPRHWARAWKAVLFAPEGAAPAGPPPAGSPAAFRLFFARPEVQRLFGRERRRPQPALRLPAGGGVSLY